jgi:hypothetical protein
MRRPDDPEPDPPGGRAAERLRDFMQKRVPPVSEEGAQEKNEPAGDSVPQKEEPCDEKKQQQ